jgi:hypothetical protein
MKAYWGMEVWLNTFFDHGTRWRWMVSFTSRPLYPQGKSPYYPLDREWVGPRAGLDAVSKRKIPNLLRDSNSDRSGRSQSPYQLSYPGSFITDDKSLNWTVTGYGLDDRGSVPSRGRLLSSPCPDLLCVTVSLSDQSPPSSPGIKNTWSFSSTSPYVFLALSLETQEQTSVLCCQKILTLCLKRTSVYVRIPL